MVIKKYPDLRLRFSTGKYGRHVDGVFLNVRSNKVRGRYLDINRVSPTSRKIELVFFSTSSKVVNTLALG
jgi:hypothetical protein